MKMKREKGKLLTSMPLFKQKRVRRNRHLCHYKCSVILEPVGAHRSKLIFFSPYKVTHKNTHADQQKFRVIGLAHLVTSHCTHWGVFVRGSLHHLSRCGYCSCSCDRRLMFLSCFTVGCRGFRDLCRRLGLLETTFGDFWLWRLVLLR